SPRYARHNSRPSKELLSHVYGVGAPLAAAKSPGAAYLLVCVWTVTRAFPRMRRPILSPPWFPVLPPLVICPSPRGGGTIRRELDITPRPSAQDAEAQDDAQQTCHHGQAPSMTSMGVEAGRDAMRDDTFGSVSFEITPPRVPAVVVPVFPQ